jgi:hypothetical protein
MQVLRAIANSTIARLVDGLLPQFCQFRRILPVAANNDEMKKL